MSFRVRILTIKNSLDFDLSDEAYSDFILNNSRSCREHRFDALDYCQKFGKQVGVYEHSDNGTQIKHIWIDECIPITER